MNESTNFGLKTTGDNDQWRNTLDYHNENMGVIDAVLANNQNALGIIVDGNKAAVSATTGQYIILRNSTITGKTDGLYTAAKSIPANTAIDGTYLTAVSGGGLNALNGKMTSTSLYAGRTSDTTVTLSEPYTNFLFVMITAQTNVDFQCMMIPTSVIASNRNFQFMMSASSNAGQQTYPLQYNSNLAIKFTDSTHCAIGQPTYNNPNWALSVNSIYGVIRK